MVQKYQNEIPPIFYYGISTKTSEKDLKFTSPDPRSHYKNNTVFNLNNANWCSKANDQM